ncbi:MAG: Gfo/Idh/MocA family oxidoreductase, partial [Sciscionella sp.]
SYGPGRYDPEYELAGRDYPIGYIRWTERRNLECFLDLLARRRIDVEPLISHVAHFADAVATYRALNEGDLKAVAVLFEYRDKATTTARPVVSSVPVPVPAAAGGRALAGPLRVAFIGAGNYACSMLLPHLTRREDVELRRVVTTSALSGANARRKFGFAEASTDLDAALADPSTDAVFIVTRHSSHAELTSRALRAGKAVFVEKPLALSEAEVTTVLDAIGESGNDRLQVGFNRRFAPLLREAMGRFGHRGGPASIRYLVNACRLEHGSWYTRTATEGSRFVGEGGHFIDTASALLLADPSSVYAVATPSGDDVQVLLRYPDGSTATISYLTSGAASFPKETVEVIADGRVLRFDDFTRASVYGRKRWASSRIPRGRDKGQAAEVDAFVTAVRAGGPMPVAVSSLAATTLATLAVHTSLAVGAPVRIELPVPAGSERQEAPA